MERILYSAHKMLAGITEASELELDKDEAHELAEAAAMVGRHYDMAIPEKTVDWSNLLMVAGAVYGTRIAVLLKKRRDARAPNSGVIDIPNPLKAKVAPAPGPAAPPKQGEPIRPASNGGVADIQIPGVGSIRRSVN